MWSMVLGLPVGILIAVLILPVYPPGFGAYALIVLLLSLAAAVVCLRYGYPALRALRQISVLLAACLAGVGLGTFVEQRLNPWGLQPGTTYYLTGTVSGVPKWGKYSRRYWLETECVGTRADRCDVFQNFLTLLWPVVVELTVSNPKVELQPGQTVRIQVQARSSRQDASPAQFNVARWLRTNHVVARVKLAKSSPVAVLSEPLVSVDRLRADLNRYLATRPSLQGAGGSSGLSPYPVLLALVTGDRALMEDRHWYVFNRTGTTHLVAISGLHVGLVAAFVTLVTLPLFRRWRWLTARYPASHGALILAWGAALYYTALAGFALPTQRALIMLSVFVLLKLTGKARQLWFGLALAFCLVLVWDPVACLSLGFWLSFVAVYLILWLIGGSVDKPSIARQWTTVQLGLFVGLAPVLLWSVHSVSLVSAGTNIIAIPVIGFVVVPLTLIWASLWTVCPDQVQFLLQAVAVITDGLLWLLEMMASGHYSVWSVGQRGFGSLLLALLGVLWLVSAGLPGRIWGWLLMLPLLLPQVQGTGLYVMGSGVARLLVHDEERVWSISDSHWPQPVARWQSSLLQHWGIGWVQGGLGYHNSAALWLAPGPVITEFTLRVDGIGSRHLSTATYHNPCEKAHWRIGDTEIQRYSAESYPAQCAVGFEFNHKRWLYWPVQGVRAQLAIQEQLAGEQFDMLLLMPGRGRSTLPGLLTLLAPDARLITMKALSANDQEAVEASGIPVHVVKAHGYYHEPLP